MYMQMHSSAQQNDQMYIPLASLGYVAKENLPSVAREQRRDGLGTLSM
jgi:hypothetical protein